jgi:hypothetical protein
MTDGAPLASQGKPPPAQKESVLCEPVCLCRYVGGSRGPVASATVTALRPVALVQKCDNSVVHAPPWCVRVTRLLPAASAGHQVPLVYIGFLSLVCRTPPPFIVVLFLGIVWDTGGSCLAGQAGRTGTWALLQLPCVCVECPLLDRLQGQHAFKASMPSMPVAASCCCISQHPCMQCSV